MPSALYNSGSMNLWDGVIDILTETKDKVMLIDNVTYTFDRDHDLVDEGGAADLIDAEVSGTGYVAGYGGSGRKALASKTITVDKTNDRSDFDAADITWTGIDVGDVGAAVLVVEDALGVTGNDTETRPVMFDDTNFPVTTNSGDLTLQITDLIRLSTI